MKVVVYIPDYNEEHANLLRAFAEGVPDAEVRRLNKFDPSADVAVVFGWYKYAYQPTMAKKPIIDHHLKSQSLIVIESAFLKRKEYYQIGWNGFAGFADFQNDGMPLDRWHAMNVQVQPWTRRTKGLVVVCGQLSRDTQVQDVDHLAWCRETFAECRRRFGDRAVFRPHPRCVSPSEYGIDARHHDTRKLYRVLDDASLVVTWNSTTGVNALVAGVPVVAMNRGSMSWPVAAHNLDDAPFYPARKEWAAGIGYAQWTPEEMAQGLPWQHLTRNMEQGVVNAG